MASATAVSAGGGDNARCRSRRDNCVPVQLQVRGQAARVPQEGPAVRARWFARSERYETTHASGGVAPARRGGGAPGRPEGKCRRSGNVWTLAVGSAGSLTPRGGRRASQTRTVSARLGGQWLGGEGTRSRLFRAVAVLARFQESLSPRISTRE